MKPIRLTYFALLTLVSASSCSKDDAERDVTGWTGKDIYFKTSIADITSSRGQNMTFDGLKSFQVTCFTTQPGEEEQDAILSKDGDRYLHT